ncbi:hypothetical protein BJ138DRAFT_1116577 [Hygrophoropsis aurantiaca]|uniref:Uncharacterized protein n=1 Tax=Hygrophoropsis aurantiaca TaxID=72124 RepID=A0ACB8A330_9AGAM|nr:hypothetical protein BJ138DRAFT_1116577 [Hygrophoropsis aurantiaca]
MSSLQVIYSSHSPALGAQRRSRQWATTLYTRGGAKTPEDIYYPFYSTLSARMPPSTTSNPTSSPLLITKQWTTCTTTSIFRLSPRITEFNSPLFNKCGIQWQFLFSRKTQRIASSNTTTYSRKRPRQEPPRYFSTTDKTTFVLSSRWHYKDQNHEQAAMDVVVGLEYSLDDDDLPKAMRIKLIPNSPAEYEIGRWSDSDLDKVVTLSMTVTILEASNKGSQASPHNFATSAHSIHSRSLPTASVMRSSTSESSISQAAALTLARSLNSGAFFDTEFIACSRRTASNRSGTTQIVYAHSTVLEAVFPNLALDKMAAREDKLFLGDGATRRERVMEIVDDYEYESDSDLDEDEDIDNGGEPTDAIKLAPPTNITNVIYVKGTAHKTQVIVLFALISSQLTLDSDTAGAPLYTTVILVTLAFYPSNPVKLYPGGSHGIKRISALDIDVLKTTALAAIEEHLSKANVLGELFSKFTSQYPLVQAMETKVLLKNRTEPEVIEALPKITQKIFQGEMPHAATVLSDVMQKVFRN